jgi:hypothetical protein
MKTCKWFVIGILFVQLFMASCTKIFIHEISRSPEFFLSPGSSKTAVIVGDDKIPLNDFVKTFDKIYDPQRLFVDDYISLFTDKLQQTFLFSAVRFDMSPQWARIKSTSGAKEDLAVVDYLYSTSNANYVINITSFDLTRRIDKGTPYDATTPNMPPSPYYKEYCIVKAHIQVIDVKTRKVVSEFESDGQSLVFLFTYKVALEKAMESSVEHAVAFLKTGKKEFKR